MSHFQYLVCSFVNKILVNEISKCLCSDFIYILHSMQTSFGTWAVCRYFGEHNINGTSCQIYKNLAKPTKLYIQSTAFPTPIKYSTELPTDHLQYMKVTNIKAAT